MFLEADRYWPDFCRLIGRDDLADDPRFVDLAARDEHAEACVAELDAEFAPPHLRGVEGAARRPSTRRGRRCRRSRSCSTTRRSSPTTTSARSCVDGGAAYRLPSVPVQFDERAPAAAARSGARRALGAVLLELGYTWDDIAALQDGRGDPVSDRATLGRPVPVPDERSAPFWEAAAEHVLALGALLARAARSRIPPDLVCPHCHSTEPGFAFEPVSGRGIVRSWTVVRQSFLPGFDDDLPFVLVDVELDEQADLRHHRPAARRRRRAARARRPRHGRVRGPRRPASPLPALRAGRPS